MAVDNPVSSRFFSPFGVLLAGLSVPIETECRRYGYLSLTRLIHVPAF